MDAFAPPDFEVAVGPHGWEDAAAESLRRGGFCVLRGAAVDAELCGRCSAAAEERLRKLLPLVGARGLDAERDAVMFRELCKRMHHRRFDVRLPLPEGSGGEDPLPGASALPAAQAAAWAVLHARAHERAEAVLRRALGGRGGLGVDTAGCVVSLPGSGDQNFHQDGSLEGFFNVFVPLVAVTAENGPTQFLPGSHRPARAGLAFGEADAEPLAPTLALGDLLIFDYRVRHRGLANRSGAARPVAYLVYARAGLSDVHNFPSESLLLSGEVLASAEEPGAGEPGEPGPPGAERGGGAEGAPAGATGQKASSSEAEAREFRPPARAGADEGQSWWRRLPFDSSAQRLLGVDGDPEDTEYREVRGACFAAARPVPLTAPRLVLWQSAASDLLGAPSGAPAPPADELCGNRLPAQASTAAHCYCGHQYGSFSGQLGDGAALSLGELAPAPGRRLELNLKGTGINALSRWWYPGLNGRKHTSAMVKEMLLAEALHALGVPTTRALAVVAGHDSAGGTAAPCATLLRAAETFVRFGSFEVTLPHGVGHHAPSAFDWTLLRKLASYCVDSFFAPLREVPDDEDEEDEDLRASPRFEALLLEATRRTARLVASWQCLGAVHGMLNTDNLSIVGVTLDHGSFGFVDHYAASFAGRRKDQGGRYSLGGQAEAARWACERLAEAMLPLHCIPVSEMVPKVASTFDEEFAAKYREGMAAKLGLPADGPAAELVPALVELMEATGADWTCTFRALADADCEERALEAICRWCAAGCAEQWRGWLRRYTDLLPGGAAAWASSARRGAMCAVNPAVVPREWILDLAAKAAEAGDYAEVERVFELLAHPFRAPERAAEAWPPSMPQLDPASLGQLGPRVVQALEDADFWRALCPHLRVGCPELAAGCRGSGFELPAGRAEALRAAMARNGVFTLAPDALPWAVDLAALARGVELLHEAGWPPSFIWLFDEPWVALSQLAALGKQVLGLEVSFDVRGSRAVPGEGGAPFHRERPLAGRAPHGTGFGDDGVPAFAMCWVPLTDATPAGPCLMCVPRGHDPGYLEKGKLTCGPDLLHHVLPLPTPRGGACVYSHRLFHWGRSGDAVGDSGQPAPPLSALSFALVAGDGAFEAPLLPRRLLPLPPLRLRAALAAAQTLVRGAGCWRPRGGSEVTPELLWSCFLACGDQFDASFCGEVLRASPLGQA